MHRKFRFQDVAGEIEERENRDHFQIPDGVFGHSDPEIPSINVIVSSSLFCCPALRAFREREVVRLSFPLSFRFKSQNQDPMNGN